MGEERVLLENAIGLSFILFDVFLALWFFGGFRQSGEDAADAGEGAIHDDARTSIVPETVH